MKTILIKLLMLYMVMYFVGIYSFFMKSNHLLNMLLSLEFLSMIIYLSLFNFIWMSLEKFILMYFLVFCVCEGAFGISILVSLIRSFGNDYMQSSSFMKC